MFWPVVNSFWRNSENWAGTESQILQLLTATCCFASSQQWNEPKTKWSYWPVTTLLSPTLIALSRLGCIILYCGQNKISTSRLSVSSGARPVVSGSIYWHHFVTMSVWGDWWRPGRYGHISIQPLPGFHTNMIFRKKLFTIVEFSKMRDYQINRVEECEDKLWALVNLFIWNNV